MPNLVLLPQSAQFLQKCLNKQATVGDDPTGIRWINNDLIGLK